MKTMKWNCRKTMSASVAMAVLAMFAQSVPAYAQVQTYTLDIPSQELGSALIALARATQQQITFDSNSVKGKRSPALKGQYGVLEALDALLLGSGLHVESGQSGLLIVRPGPTPVAENAEVAGALADPVAEPQAVVVTGYRASLQQALQVKRNASEIMEAVGLDDMGKLPDKSIADSVKQLPGVTATIDRGNASQIIIRGMGPALSFTTLDGREVASAEPDRSVRLEQFPAELMSGAEVYKTQSANLIEGGIAGTVNLKTVDPLDLKKQRISLSGSLAYYPQASKLKNSDSMNPALDLSHEHFKNSLSTSLFGNDTPLGTKLSFGYVDQFLDRTLGVAVGLGYQDQQSTYKGFAGWGYMGAPKNAQGDVTPWGFQSYQGGGREQRNSLLTKVQWRPEKGVELGYQLYYAQKNFNEFDTERWVDAWQSTDYIAPIARDGYVVGGKVVPEDFWHVNAHYVQDQSELMNAAYAKLRLGEWTVKTDLSSSRARSNSSWSAIESTMKNAPTVSWNTDTSRPGFSVSGDNPNSLDSYNPGSAYTVAPQAHLKDELTAFRVDLSRHLDAGPFSRLDVGVRLSKRDKDYGQLSWKVKGACQNVTSLASFSVALQNCDAAAISADDKAAQPTDVTAGWHVNEKVRNAYAQLEINSEIGGIPVTGNVGLRAVTTESRSDGIQATTWSDESTNWADVTTYSPASISQRYTNVLPSLNLVFQTSDQHMWRFGMARAMSRAPIDALRVSSNLSRDWSASGAALSGTAGNPLLKPFVADQVDVYHDWYFAPASLASAGLFYKKVNTYIGVTTHTEMVDGRPATVSAPANGNGGYIRGLELVYQQSFKNLPEFFTGAGLFANYSFVDSNIKDFQPINNPVGLSGLTRHNFNANLWMEHGDFSARLGFSYHSPYTFAVTADPTGVVKSARWWNLGLAQKIGKSEIKFQIDNLTNSKLENTVQQQSFNWGKYQEFGRRFLLTWSTTF